MKQQAFNKALGQLLQGARAGIGQHVAAQHIGIAPGTLSRIENGHADLTVWQLVQLAEFIEAPLLDLLTDALVKATAAGICKCGHSHDAHSWTDTRTTYDNKGHGSCCLPTCICQCFGEQ